MSTIGHDGDVVTLKQHTPFTPQDTKELKQDTPTYEEEPITIIKKDGFLFHYKPSYKDIEKLLQAFLTECERNKLISHVNKT